MKPPTNAIHVWKGDRYTTFIYIYIYMFPLQIISFSLMDYYRIEYSSLYYTVGPCWLSILYVVVCICWGFPGGSVIKNLPAMPEMQALSLGKEDPLKQEMPTYSRILAWKIPQTEEPGGLQSMGSQKSRTQLSD